MKYLTEIEIRTLINLGKVVEMFLGKNKELDSIDWLAIQKRPDSIYQLSVHSVFDDGDLNHLDLYSFSRVNPDELFQTISFGALDELLAYIKKEYKPDQLRFVNRGMIQEEYRLLKSNEQS